MLLHATTLSYLIGAAAYFIAFGLVLAGAAQHRYRILLLSACMITALLASGIVAASLMAAPAQYLAAGIALLEQFRSAVWIAVVAFALIFACGRPPGRAVAVTLIVVTVCAMTYSASISILPVLGIGKTDLLERSAYLANVVIALVAILLIENVFRHSGREARWSVKYLCIGLGVTFSYDFFVYAQAALLGGLDSNSYAARGLVQAIAMPLIILSAARSRNWPVDVHVSRNFVFHSATLLVAGTYLIVMAVAGYSLRIFDSPWGTVSQVTFLVASLVLLAAVLSSGEAQARLKAFINQNFFTYRYDYRVEWLRFIDSISDSAQAFPIPQRVIHALANIIGSTSAKIWVKQDGEPVFQVAAAWNMGSTTGKIPATDPWLEAFADCPDVIDLRRNTKRGESPFAANLPSWLTAETRALIILPLVHADTLIGFVVLGEMRAPRAFHWEDFQLLKIAARQAASYVAEETAVTALGQIRKFEEFNQRFAFIIHDVKNLAAQMTLILKNAERHAGNPEFQADILHTISESATRLRMMLEQLKSPVAAPGTSGSIDLVVLLRGIFADWKLQLPRLKSSFPEKSVYVRGHAEPLRAVVNHLIQNAADVTGPDGYVGLELRIEGEVGNGPSSDEKCWAVISVTDDGPGMELAFIENELFRPLSSSKSAGFGIGAFQAREVARAMGGRLDVESKLGHGTRITVCLPYAPFAEDVNVRAAQSPPRNSVQIRKSA
jgi:putative PEP-CTERM system histidine kinase